MKPLRKIILFDIDHTLFNMDKFRERMFGEIVEKIKHESIPNLEVALQDTYFLYRKESGTFDPKEFTKYLVWKMGINAKPEILEEEITKESIFEGHLYEETEEVLDLLSRDKSNRIGIFSGGNIDFQKKKIKKIEEYFHKEHIYVFTFKMKELKSVVKRYKNDQLYIVDDQLEILHFAKKRNQKITTVWVKRGRFALRHQGIPGFQPDATITDLRQVVELV